MKIKRNWSMIDTLSIRCTYKQFREVSVDHPDLKWAFIRFQVNGIVEPCLPCISPVVKFTCSTLEQFLKRPSNIKKALGLHFERSRLKRTMSLREIFEPQKEQKRLDEIIDAFVDSTVLIYLLFRLNLSASLPHCTFCSTDHPRRTSHEVRRLI